MSTFWSWWVMFLVTLNLGITLFLFIWGIRVAIPTLPDGTTGHVWAHGVIKEGVHDLPRWWVLFSALMFVCAFAYLVLYPGFGKYAGMLGWTSEGELQQQTLENQQKLDAALGQIQAQSLVELGANPPAMQIGERLFHDNCAACHGRQANGNVAIGAPDLTDAAWLYGNSEQALLASIRDGRNGVMPAWQQLGADTVENLVQYVRSLSGAPHIRARAATGAQQFMVCAACHGADGRGNQALGAPDLTDDIWLYGGDLEALTATIARGRQGHMPAWGQRLSEDDIRLLAAWIVRRGTPD